MPDLSDAEDIGTWLIERAAIREDSGAVRIDADKAAFDELLWIWHAANPIEHSPGRCAACTAPLIPPIMSLPDGAQVAPRGLGRPLQASEAQIKEVRKLRKAGISLRGIAEQTGLGLRTVRTIVGKDAGTDRTSKRTNLLRKREIDRQRAADYRAQKRTRDNLPKRITEIQKRGEALIKAAKGLGD